MPSNVLPLHLKQTFQPMIWIFTEGDKIDSKAKLLQLKLLQIFARDIFLMKKWEIEKTKHTLTITVLKVEY